MTRHVLLVAVLGLLTAACGKSDQQKQADEAASRVQQGTPPPASPTAQPTTQSVSPTGQGSARSVDFEQLKALLPEVAGWTRSGARGEQLTLPVSYSRAQARYERDRAHIELEITDSALSQLLLAPIAMFVTAGYSERSDEGFKRATRIGGQPGMEEWNVDSKRGEATAIVGNRFIVHAVGHDVDAIDPVRKIVEAVDFSTLTTLK